MIIIIVIVLALIVVAVVAVAESRDRVAAVLAVEANGGAALGAAVARQIHVLIAWTAFDVSSLPIPKCGFRGTFETPGASSPLRFTWYGTQGVEVWVDEAVPRRAASPIGQPEPGHRRTPSRGRPHVMTTSVNVGAGPPAMTMLTPGVL